MLTSKYSGRHKEISSIKNCKNKTMHYEYHQFCFQEKSIPTSSDFSEKAAFPRFKHTVFSLLLLFPSFLADPHATVGNRPAMTTDRSALAETSMYSTKSQPDTNTVNSPQSILI